MQCCWFNLWMTQLFWKSGTLYSTLSGILSLKILTENCHSQLKTAYDMKSFAEIIMTETFASMLTSEKAVSGHTESPDVISQALKTYLVRRSLLKIPTKDFIIKYWGEGFHVLLTCTFMPGPGLAGTWTCSKCTKPRHVYLNLRSLNVSHALGRPPLISHILLWMYLSRDDWQLIGQRKLIHWL